MIHDNTPTDFYSKLSAFRDFRQVTDPSHYADAPSDWVVVITDIKGSTRAIAENRYKDVNLMGAASITAVLNALGNRKIPFVFGGDGATFLVPGADLDRVAPALLAVQTLAREKFKLEIRAGFVPVSELASQGAKVQVAKFQVSKDSTLAMLRGGGLSLAEKWIKSPEHGPRYSLESLVTPSMAPADLAGLSCRWNPVPNKNGEMISLLVLALGPVTESPVIYNEVLRGIEIISNDAPDSHPVTVEKLDTRFRLRNLRSELKAQNAGRPLLGKLRYALSAVFFGVVTVVGHRRDWKFKFFEPRKYVGTMVANTDFRKFDDMIRMIRDCGPEQTAQIRVFLEGKRREGKIAYGLHVSSHALMTCMLFDLTDHIHFIDGSDGGYAVAAKMLKEQLASANSPL